MLALSFLDGFSWFNSSLIRPIIPNVIAIQNQNQSIHMLSYLYLNITSALLKAKQVLFSLPILSTIFCIYLYLLSIEELGLSGVGGLPTPSPYTTRSPYCWTHILISLYPYIWISVFRTLFA